MHRCVFTSPPTTISLAIFEHDTRDTSFSLLLPVSFAQRLPMIDIQALRPLSPLKRQTLAPFLSPFGFTQSIAMLGKGK